MLDGGVGGKGPLAGKEEGFLYPLVLHPDTSGMAHVIGMIDEMVGWLKGQGGVGEVEFWTYGDAAEEWKGRQKI